MQKSQNVAKSGETRDWCWVCFSLVCRESGTSLANQIACTWRLGLVICWVTSWIEFELSLSYCFLPFLHLKQILRMSHWSWRKKVSFHSRSKFQDIKGSHKRIKTPKHFSYWTLLAKKFLPSRWRIISTFIRKFTINHGVCYYISPVSIVSTRLVESDL